MLRWHCCLKQKLCLSELVARTSIDPLAAFLIFFLIFLVRCFKAYHFSFYIHIASVLWDIKGDLTFLQTNNFGNKNVSCHFTKFLTWQSVISQVPDDGILKIRRPVYKRLLKSCAMCWPKRWYRTNLSTVSVLVNRSMQVSDTKGVP